MITFICWVCWKTGHCCASYLLNLYIFKRFSWFIFILIWKCSAFYSSMSQCQTSKDTKGQGERNKKNENPTPVSCLICTFNDFNSCAWNSSSLSCWCSANAYAEKQTMCGALITSEGKDKNCVGVKTPDALKSTEKETVVYYSSHVQKCDLRAHCYMFRLLLFHHLVQKNIYYKRWLAISILSGCLLYHSYNTHCFGLHCCNISCP